MIRIRKTVIGSPKVYTVHCTECGSVIVFGALSPIYCSECKGILPLFSELVYNKEERISNHKGETDV